MRTPRASRPGVTGARTSRAGVGHRPRGLQRRRQRLGLLPARPRPLPRLPVERGRPGRGLRRPPAAVPRPGASGTARDPILKERIVRPDRPGGQPRRGRQGVLVVPGLHADPLVDALALPLPAGRVPLRRAASTRTGAAARDDPEYELVDTGVFDDDRYWEVTVDYAKAAPDDLLHRGSRSRNAGPEQRHAARAAHAVVPQHVVVGRRRRAGRSSTRRRRQPLVAEHAELGRRAAGRRRATRRPLFCDNETNARPAVRRGRQPDAPTPRTASTTTSSHGGGHGQPGTARAPRRRCGHRAARCRGGCRPAEVRLRARPAAPATACGDGFGDDRWRDREREADAFYADAHAARRSRGRGAGPAPGLRRDAVVQAVLPLRRRPLAGRRPGQPAAAARALARAATRVEAPEQPRRASRCPTSGSTPGTPPGTWPSTASRSPTSTPSSPRTSCILLLPRVVHAPQRPAPRLRVGVRRRQPAGARVGGAAGVRDRRRRRTTTSSSGCCTSCCSTSPGGSTARTPTATTSSRAASSAWTTSARSTARPRCRSTAASSSPTAPRWMAMYCLNLLEMALVLAEHDRRYEDLATKFFEHFAYIASAHERAGACGTRRTASTTTCCAARRRARSRCGCARWSGCCRWPR